MVDIGFGAIMGRQQLDRPRREIEDLKPDVDQRRADRGAQYIGQPRIGERRADKLMGAQYLESLALKERGRGTLRQVRRGQVDATRARNGERRIAERLPVAHAGVSKSRGRGEGGVVRVDSVGGRYI